MKRLFALIVAAALCLPSIGARAWWQSIQQVSISAGATFQGPGDIVSGATAWGSCARAYNAAYANGTNPLCDLKDATTGTVSICTLRVLTTGFVDLAGTYCTGSATPAVACAAAAGGACIISKVYDQTGTGNHFIQATAATMPALTFSALGGLPGLTFVKANNTAMSAGTLTFNQPFTMSCVFKRTANTADGETVLAGQGSSVGLGPASSANLVGIIAPTELTVAATESVFHASQGVFNNLSSAVVADGTVTTGTAGAANITAVAFRLGRSQAGNTLDGVIMEAGIWPALAMTTGGGSQTALLNTNQHSAANGYNF